MNSDLKPMMLLQSSSGSNTKQNGSPVTFRCFFLIITLSKHDFSDNEEAILTTSTSQWVDELEEKPEINEFGQISSSQNFLPSASNSLELTNLGQEIQQSQDNQFPSSWYSYPYQNGTRDSFSNSLLSFNETSNPVSIS